jgi:hypothetical protein
MKSSKVSKLRKKPHRKEGSSDKRKLKNREKSANKAVPQTPPSTDQQTAFSASRPVSVRISRIVVEERLRKDNMATVAVIAESMRELGQLSPIWLRRREVKNSKLVRRRQDECSSQVGTALKPRRRLVRR